MVAKINEICAPFGYAVDFDKDVVPLSSFNAGGSITERHVLFALTKKIADGADREEAISVINTVTGGLSDKNKEKLRNAPEEYYLYDILGILKSSLVKKIYVDADEELMPIANFVKLSHEMGAICAYAYLGDVGESPTGDKAAQTFEDSYLDELFVFLKDAGFDAVTYMPSRNTKEQLERVMNLAREYSLFQISGEDINSPRQKFICPAMKDYRHLYEATYALIGHEKAATENIENAMFSAKTAEKFPNLEERIKYYADLGRKI